MPQLNYSFIEKGPIADPVNWKYFYSLKDRESFPVLQIPNFLSPEEFAGLKKSVAAGIHSQALNQAIAASVTTSDVGKPLEHTKVDDVRTTKIIPVHPAVLDAHKERIQKAVADYWAVDSAPEPVHGWQCLLYEIGGHYRWHSDGFNFREGKWHLYYPKRSFALIFCMNDWTHGYPHQEQFSGGELVFTHIVDQYQNRLTVYPKANSLILFPTTYHYLHQVNPVREGRRITFVNWWGNKNA